MAVEVNRELVWRLIGSVQQMSDAFQNKYEQEAHAIVKDLKGTKWEPVIGPERNETTVPRPNLVLGLLALALFAIWRLR
jgi:hypothetical protein